MCQLYYRSQSLKFFRHNIFCLVKCEIIKVHRLAANNKPECCLVEQQKGWVIWVSVKCWIYLVHEIVHMVQEIFWDGIKWYKIWRFEIESKERIWKKFISLYLREHFKQNYELGVFVLQIINFWNFAWKRGHKLIWKPKYSYNTILRRIFYESRSWVIFTIRQKLNSFFFKTPHNYESSTPGKMM